MVKEKKIKCVFVINLKLLHMDETIFHKLFFKTILQLCRSFIKPFFDYWHKMLLSPLDESLCCIPHLEVTYIKASSKWIKLMNTNASIKLTHVFQICAKTISSLYDSMPYRATGFAKSHVKLESYTCGKRTNMWHKNALGWLEFEDLSQSHSPNVSCLSTNCRINIVEEKQ